MQDEITKHTEKIYKAVKKPGHFREKIQEILIEIFIIVFAVTLSIWLHSWSEHRHQQKEVREFLSDLKEDLNGDIKSMQAARDSLSRNAQDFLFIEQLTKERLDSLDKNKISFGFHSVIGTTKISNGNYEGFKSSGKIGFIENKQLKKLILKYYHGSTPDVLEAEKINASQVLKISDYMSQNAEQGFNKTMLSPNFKRMLEIFSNSAKASLIIYTDAISNANEILTSIDTEEGK